MLDTYMLASTPKSLSMAIMPPITTLVAAGGNIFTPRLSGKMLRSLGFTISFSPQSTVNTPTLSRYCIWPLTLYTISSGGYILLGF